MRNRILNFRRQLFRLLQGKSVDKSGFTLLEMCLVLIIVGILLLIIIPNMMTQKENAQETGDKALVKTVETQAVLYENAKNAKPKLGDLESNGYLTSEQVTRYKLIPADKKTNAVLADE